MPASNITFAIDGVSCSEGSLTVAENCVLRINIFSKSFAHRKCANRYLPFSIIRDLINKITNMKTTISFLLGSGFSHADGIPLMPKINKMLLEIKESEFYIDSQMNAFRLKENSQKGFTLNSIDEKFFVEFIKYYSNTLISSPDQFNYEELIDYIEAYRRFGNNAATIHQFCQDYRNSLMTQARAIDDDNNLVYRFKIYLNKVISNMLQSSKYYESVGLMNYPPFDTFISVISELLKTYFVKVHTLNHDLLFEHIASKHVDIWQDYSDGYEELNSPYYGEISTTERITKTYHVRLKQFNANFDSNLSLYKLHGSVDTYIADISQPENEQVRIKKDYGVDRIIKEVLDKNTNKWSYINTIQNNYPEFLSGSTTKIIQYNDPFFELLFKRLEENLGNSDILFVIGYGFKDDGINNILIRHFLSKGKKMIVINRTIPNKNIISNFKVAKIEKSLIDVTFNEFMAEIIQ